MRRGLCISFFMLLLLLLSACRTEDPVEERIQISILESQGFTVENNGQYVQPGEDVVFLLKMDSGYSIADANYDGVYRVAVDGGQVELTLEDVRYPTRVALRLTSRYCSIIYLPNGGTGEETAITYDTSNHPRPNTSNGVRLFSREGCTLVGWNTRPDGTGDRIGLGSRVSVPMTGLTLYAQWAEWSDAADFTCRLDGDTVTITGYHGGGPTVVIPAVINGREVTAVSCGAFRDCAMTALVLPATMQTVEDGAFQNCALETVTLYDNIEAIGDAGFDRCDRLQTLYINAIELPYGTGYRKESCYADKVDLLIRSQGQKRIVFYGGCSVWYNLDSSMLAPLVNQGYQVVNMGLNGTVNSPVQMQIMGNFLRRGDILFHTPELSGGKQLLAAVDMDEKDDKLWCGLEYNYDLFALVDLRTVPGAFDSFCSYLSMKKSGTDYNAVYTEGDDKTFCDQYGCVPFYRDGTKDSLPDRVYLDPAAIDGAGMARLKAFYDRYRSQGVRVYLSYACVNMDDVPENQRGNVELMDRLFREAVEKMDGPVLISSLEDFLYHHNDFYDTNYHLRSQQARKNTAVWLRDLQIQMEQDGLWEAL